MQPADLSLLAAGIVMEVHVMPDIISYYIYLSLCVFYYHYLIM